MKITLVALAPALAPALVLLAQPAISHAASTESPAMPAASAVIRSINEAPPEVAEAQPKAQLLGQGSLRFFGLLVYDARLWASPGFKPEAYDSQAFALQLDYARKLDGGSIAERSIAEMRRVGEFSEEQAQTWLAEMRRAFPDVVAKDRLIGVYDGRGEVRFFHNGRLSAQINGRSFARLFFGIWLDPKTSAPALRKSLIGLAE